MRWCQGSASLQPGTRVWLLFCNTTAGLPCPFNSLCSLTLQLNVHQGLLTDEHLTTSFLAAHSPNKSHIITSTAQPRFRPRSLGLQLDGAAYAYTCSQLSTLGLTLGYLGLRAARTAGTPEAVPLAPSAAALSGWGPYLALAVPATVMACMEGWAVEVSNGSLTPSLHMGVAQDCIPGVRWLVQILGPLARRGHAARSTWPTVPSACMSAAPCRAVSRNAVPRNAPQVLIFLSGRLPNAEVAVGVTGLCLQFSTLVWLSASAISSATTTRVANALGKVGCLDQWPGATRVWGAVRSLTTRQELYTLVFTSAP